MSAGDLLSAILPHLDRGDAPDSKWPDAKGEYWALCPFHPDTHATNFSVSERGYKCFACGAEGGLSDLAQRLGITREAVARLHGYSGVTVHARMDNNMVIPGSAGGQIQAQKAILGPFGRKMGQSGPQLDQMKDGGGVDGQAMQPDATGRATADATGHATAEGLTLEEYAEAKRLPVEFLVGLGLTTQKFLDHKVVAIPYANEDGMIVGTHIRHKMHGEGRFTWRRGSKLTPYGISNMPTSGDVWLVEGESDAQTLWLHGVPAVGIPGATTFKAAWAPMFEGHKVYVWKEPDEGGEAFEQSIGKHLPDAVIVEPPAGIKDVSDAHLAGMDVPKLLEKLKAGARSFAERRTQALNEEAEEARKVAWSLITSPNILAELEGLLPKLGLVGEGRNAKLLYLALTSRLSSKPVSVAVKGPSAAGKSFLVETILKTMPEAAYLDFTSMSEHALVYDERPISHRMIVLYEAAGLGQDKADEPSTLAYMMRSLISEGKVKYTVVEKRPDGTLGAREIQREGPTGLITTTTLASLHAENETRMLTLTIRDDREQTKAIFRALSGNYDQPEDLSIELARWKAFQRWLELAGRREATIPFAHELAELFVPVAVRSRRDFTSMTKLIEMSALLHQANREVDEYGRVIATLEDYATVYDLAGAILAELTEATVPPAVRETVRAVEDLYRATGEAVSTVDIAKKLNLDRTTAWRRMHIAMREEYLVNEEERRGHPAMLKPGGPLPDDIAVIPTPDDLARACAASTPNNRATVQPVDQGDESMRACAASTPNNRATVQPMEGAGEPEEPEGEEPEETRPLTGTYETIACICPRCHRPVKAELDTCPYCGADMGADYQVTEPFQFN